jgi:hypothetical protein
LPPCEKVDPLGSLTFHRLVARFCLSVRSGPVPPLEVAKSLVHIPRHSRRIFSRSLRNARSTAPSNNTRSSGCVTVPSGRSRTIFARSARRAARAISSSKSTIISSCSERGDPKLMFKSPSNSGCSSPDICPRWNGDLPLPSCQREGCRPPLRKIKLPS